MEYEKNDVASITVILKDGTEIQYIKNGINAFIKKMSSEAKIPSSPTQGYKTANLNYGNGKTKDNIYSAAEQMKSRSGLNFNDSNSN